MGSVWPGRNPKHPIAPSYTRVMGASSKAGGSLRARRLGAGLTQRELGERSGVPQPNIAAYESGRRSPADSTLARLDAALRVPTAHRLAVLRSEILAAAKRRRLETVRVFGSVARGEAGPDSDVDLLVHPAADASIFDLAGFMSEVQELVGVPVDVVSDRGTGPAMDRIRSEAVAL